jgi:hypothetical protein
LRKKLKRFHEILKLAEISNFSATPIIEWNQNHRSCQFRGAQTAASGNLASRFWQIQNPFVSTEDQLWTDESLTEGYSMSHSLHQPLGGWQNKIKIPDK